MKRLVALLLVLAMAVSCTVVMAEGENGYTYTYTDPDGNVTTGTVAEDETLQADASGTWEVDGDVNADVYWSSAVMALSSSETEDGITVSIYGDIKNEGYRSYGIEAWGNNIDMTATGDVEAKSVAVSAYSSSEDAPAAVTVEGNASSEGSTVCATGTAIVDVWGNVVSESEYWLDSAVYATESSNVTINGSVITDEAVGVEVCGEATVDVCGDVISAQGDAVSASGDEDGDGSCVFVGGDIQAYETGVYAYGNTTVYVEGNIVAGHEASYEYDGEVYYYITGYGISADEGSTVTTFGDVSGAYSGVETYGGTVEVNGNVSGGNYGVYSYGDTSSALIVGDVSCEETAIEAWSGEVDVYGNVIGDIYTSNEANVYVNGDVIGAAEIGVWGENTGSLVVDGTIASGSEAALTLYADDAEEAEEAIPKIEVYELAPEDENYFVAKVYDEESYEYVEDEELTEKLAESVNYILRADEAENGEISIEGTSENEELALQLAHEGESAIVTVDTEDGYYVKNINASGESTLTKNDDGTWSVLVGRGGGITITAEMLHNLVYQQVAYGKAADGSDLIWKVLQVDDRMVTLVLVEGLSEVPADFMTTAFSAEQLSHITNNGSWTALEGNALPPSLRDDLIHPSITVRLGDLLYGAK